MLETNYLSYQDSIKEAMGMQVDYAKQEVNPVIEAVWYLVKDAASWQEAYDAGVLQAYYEAYPNEDLWNATKGKKATFNDALYTCSVYSDEEGSELLGEMSLKPYWYSASVQKVTDTETGDIYYMPMFYSIDENVHELFINDTLETSAKLFIKINSKTFPDCVHAYEALDLAVQPWAVVAPPKPFEGVIEFEYNDQKFYPWGSEAKQFNKGFAIAALPEELGIPCLPAEEAVNFEKEDLKVYLA